MTDYTQYLDEILFLGYIAAIIGPVALLIIMASRR